MNKSSICHEIPDCSGLYVDAFSGTYLKKTTSSNNTFILSHYHGDHYGSLPRDYKYNGPAVIHCTPITASLLINVHGMCKSYIIPHSYGIPWIYYPTKPTNKKTKRKKRRRNDSFVDITDGGSETNNNDNVNKDDVVGGDNDNDDDDDKNMICCRITFYDANHCPGAAIIVVEVLQRSNTNTNANKHQSSLSSNINNSNMDLTTTTVTKKEKDDGQVLTSWRLLRVHVHTGDMRYHPKMMLYPILAAASKNGMIDTVLLDTTYGEPKHNFISQDIAVEQIASQVQQLLQVPQSTSTTTMKKKKLLSSSALGEDISDPDSGAEEELSEAAASTLILLSCYSIGKEKVLWEVSKRCNQPVYVSDKKLKMMRCIHDPEIDNNMKDTKTSAKEECDKSKNSNSNNIDDDIDIDASIGMINRCTRNPNESQIHVIPMGMAGELHPYYRPNYNACAEYARRQNQQNKKKTMKMDKSNGDDDNNNNITNERTDEGVGRSLSTSKSTLVPYRKVVAFIPTGWAGATNWNRKNSICRKRCHVGGGGTYNEGGSSTTTILVEIRLISYSEHSTYTELQTFINFLRPRKIIPTVFKDDNDARKIVMRFNVDSKRVKQHFLQSMMTKPTTMASTTTTTSSSTLSSASSNAGMAATTSPQLQRELSMVTAGHAVKDDNNKAIIIVEDDDDEDDLVDNSSVATTAAINVLRQEEEKEEYNNNNNNKISLLCGMGFSNHDAALALKHSKGHIETAVEQLLLKPQKQCSSSRSSSPPSSASSPSMTEAGSKRRQRQSATTAKRSSSSSSITRFFPIRYKPS